MQGSVRTLAHVQHDPGTGVRFTLWLYLDPLSQMRAQLAEPDPGRVPGGDLSSVQQFTEAEHQMPACIPRTNGGHYHPEGRVITMTYLGKWL